MSTFHSICFGKIGLILLTTGYDPAQAYIATSEVVDVLNSASSCQSIPDFPVAAHTAGGGIVNGVPIGNIYVSECWVDVLEFQLKGDL